MERRVLVLTSWMFPAQVVGWRAAVRLVYQGTAQVLAEYDEEVSSPSVTWKLPAVVRLMKTARDKRPVRWSRRNVYARDAHRCQYCGERRPEAELTFDHVVPRARGGRTTWENVVTACRACNSKKGQLSCEQAGMHPLRAPAMPKALPRQPAVTDLSSAPEEWRGFLEPYLRSKD